jgi:hypothetical protein
MDSVERCDTAFKRAVLLVCYDALETVGFTRFRKENVDWPLEGGFNCWVGLNNNLEEEYFQINPFVGIHVVPIEKLWTSFKSSGKYPAKYDRGHATYALHMGKLVPEERAFRFTRQTDVEAEAARLARLYATVGLSYARSIASYERLLPLLQERVPMLGAYPERVAACLYLMDRKEEARNFVEDFLKTHREYFEGFAVPFLKRLTH